MGEVWGKALKEKYAAGESRSFKFVAKLTFPFTNVGEQCTPSTGILFLNKAFSTSLTTCKDLASIAKLEYLQPRSYLFRLMNPAIFSHSARLFNPDENIFTRFPTVFFFTPVEIMLAPS